MAHPRIHIVAFLGVIPPRTVLQHSTLTKFGWDAHIIGGNDSQDPSSGTEAQTGRVGSKIIERFANRNKLKILRAPLLYGEYLYVMLRTLRRRISSGDIVQLNHPLLLLLFAWMRPNKARLFYDAFEFYSLVYKDFGMAGRLFARLCDLLEAHYVPKIDGVICIESRSGWMKKRLSGLNPNLLELPNLPSIRLIADEALCENLRQLYGNKKMVVYAGGLKPKKGLENFPQIVQKVALIDPDCHFLIIGSISATGSIEHWLADNRISQMCTYIPWVSSQKLFAYLRICHVGLILMSPKKAYQALGPGGGRKLFTYMAAGLPVVAPSFGCAWSMVTREGIGLQVDTTQTEAVAGAVIEILSDEERRRGMASRARELFVSRYHWEKHERSYVEHLTEC